MLLCWYFSACPQSPLKKSFIHPFFLKTELKWFQIEINFYAKLCSYRCEWSHIIGMYCSFLSEYAHVVLKSSVNYCSHSSRGAAKGQLRVPGWFWQSGTLETGAHARQSAGIAEAETHGRFSPPAYRGVPNLSPKQRTGRERARDSDVIGAQTVKQHRLLSFSDFPCCFSAVAFTSLWVRRMMWARGAVFLRRWHATAGGDNVKFPRNDRLLPTRGAQMKGNGCLLMATAVLATAPWPGRGEWVKPRQRLSRTPPGTASSSPPLSTPHRLSSTVSACVSTTANNVL